MSQQCSKAQTDHTVKPQAEDSATKNSCPQCNHVNDSGVAFCAECGQPLQVKTPCPFCGTPMYGKQNICEFCGEWLLAGKCRFCEADIEEGQLYCSDCGNLQKSIQCPGCGENSEFEICLSCGTPLTPTAKEMFANRPVSLAGVLSATSVSISSYEPSPAAPKIMPPDQNEELLGLRKYKEKTSSSSSGHGTIGKRRKSVTLFNDSQRGNIKKLENEAVIEEKRQSEERRKKEDEERLRKIKEETLRQEEMKKKALMARSEGTLYVKTLEVTISVKNEDGIADDKFWLWVNDAKVGYVGYSTGGRVSFPAQFTEGINLVELRFHRSSGVGTVASITIDPDGQQRRYGGSGNHLWMVIAK